jgi:site-specific recombinase XerD
VEADLRDLNDSFRTALRAANRSARTQQLRTMVVGYYVDWLVKHGHPTTLDQLSRVHIRGWLGDLSERVEPVTVAGYFAGLRRFCNFLVEEGELAASPMLGLTMPQIQAKPVPVLSDEELGALLRACAGRTFQCRRDEAFIRILLDCGVRVSEACGLTQGNLDVREESALVLGKGNKLRPVYFGAKTALALDRYLRERRKHRHAHLDQVFLTQRGPLTGDGARNLLRTRAAQAGLADRMNPHRFRHTFAHDFLLAGGQERDLKRMAGWSSDIMLERYGASAADLRARESARRLRRGDRV